MSLCVYSFHLCPCAGNGRSPKVPFRENFARACFEALLQLSFIHSKEASIGEYDLL